MRVLLILITGFLLSCSSGDSSSDVDDIELNKKLEEIAEQQGITGKDQLEEFKLQVMSIVKTKERFSYMALEKPCKEDIEKFCGKVSSISKKLICMKDSRDNVADLCETALRNEFGGKPSQEAISHNGVLLPIGSTFIYGYKEDIQGAMVSEDFEYRNILFKKGQVRFHDVGLSVAHLVSDQYIDGIKYKAGGIGPFFNEDGSVENATLAANAEIKGIAYKKGSQIQFYSKDVVMSGKLAEDSTIKGIFYKAGSSLWFNKDGTIRKL